MRNKKAWTNEEIAYLDDAWGKYSIPSIAENLGRTVNAVKIKAQKINLGRHLHSGEYVTLNQFMIALGRNSYGYALKSWVQNRGFPVKYKKSISKRYMVVYLEEFWEWAEKHKTFIDFTKFETGSLGPEPEWVKEQRKADELKSNFRTDPWTKEDDELLKSLVKMNLGYREVSIRVNRTEGAIKRRLLDLGIKLRPVKAKAKLWTDEQVQKLIELHRKGYSFEIIAGIVGKSALACRGKFERLEAC